MYKVLVVDDEPIIVKGLTRMIPWEKYDCTVTGTAADGKEALVLAEELRPDIIFTDIYMPGMDGLLMIAALRVTHEDMEISILTGYRDFELAQKALNLGVTRFLLKPSSLTELEEALAVMTARLKKKGILPEACAEEQKEATEAADCVDPATAEERGAAGSERSPGTGDERGTAGSERSPGTGDETSSAGGESVERDTEAGKETENETADGRSHEDSPARNFLVTAAVDYLEKNYARKLSLNEVADHVYVSQWHLSKLINQYTGKSFTELLNTIRIEKAKELLKDPAYRIADIAELVGFQDVTSFSRVFRKIEGLPANEYRNRF